MMTLTRHLPSWKASRRQERRKNVRMMLSYFTILMSCLTQMCRGMKTAPEYTWVRVPYSAPSNDDNGKYWLWNRDCDQNDKNAKHTILRQGKPDLRDRWIGVYPPPAARPELRTDLHETVFCCLDYHDHWHMLRSSTKDMTNIFDGYIKEPKDRTMPESPTNPLVEKALVFNHTFCKKCQDVIRECCVKKCANKFLLKGWEQQGVPQAVRIPVQGNRPGVYTALKKLDKKSGEPLYKCEVCVRKEELAKARRSKGTGKRRFTKGGAPIAPLKLTELKRRKRGTPISTPQKSPTTEVLVLETKPQPDTCNRIEQRPKSRPETKENSPPSLKEPEPERGAPDSSSSSKRYWGQPVPMEDNVVIPYTFRWKKWVGDWPMGFCYHNTNTSETLAPEKIRPHKRFIPVATRVGAKAEDAVCCIKAWKANRSRFGLRNTIEREIFDGYRNVLGEEGSGARKEPVIFNLRWCEDCVPFVQPCCDCDKYILLRGMNDPEESRAPIRGHRPQFYEQIITLNPGANPQYREEPGFGEITYRCWMCKLEAVRREEAQKQKLKPQPTELTDSNTHNDHPKCGIPKNQKAPRTKRRNGRRKKCNKHKRENPDGYHSRVTNASAASEPVTPYHKGSHKGMEILKQVGNDERMMKYIPGMESAEKPEAPHPCASHSGSHQSRKNKKNGKKKKKRRRKL